MKSSQYIAVVGGSNVDITGMPEGKFSPGDSNPGNVQITAGGVGRNIAENIARLDIDVKLLTAIGNDSFGGFLSGHCRKAGIDISEAAVPENRRTSIYTAVMDDEGELIAAVSDMGISCEIDEDYLSSKAQLLAGAAFVVADNNISAESLSRLLKMTGGKILFDAVSGEKLKKRESLIYNIHSIKLNSVEAEILSGISVATEEDAEKAADRIAERGIKNIFITLGADGALYRRGDSQWFLRGKKISSVNTTGCGDAFMAGIAWGFFNGEEGERLLECGMGCAAIAAGSANTVSERMSASELRKTLKGV